MSVLTDNKMRTYVHKTTGGEVVMMQSVDEVGNFVRKDVQQQRKNTASAPVKVEPAPAATVKLVARK